MSLSAITSLLGAFMTAVVQLIEDGEVKTGWPLVSLGDLISYSILVISTPLVSFLVITCLFICLAC